MVLGSGENGLFVQYIGKINKKNVKQKIKGKLYSSNHYRISIPVPLIKFLGTDKIFMKQYSKNKYKLLIHDETDTIPLYFRTLNPKSKSPRYVLTLPKKFFGFLDYEYQDDMVMNIFCYVKDSQTHVDLYIL